MRENEVKGQEGEGEEERTRRELAHLSQTFRPVLEQGRDDEVERRQLADTSEKHQKRQFMSGPLFPETLLVARLS